MNLIKRITSKLIFYPNTFHWIAGIFIGLEFFLSYLIPEEFQPFANIIIPIIYLILFIYSTFYVFFDYFTYALKDKEGLIDKTNNGNYSLVIIIMFIVWRQSYESTSVGSVLFILFAFSYILYFIRMLFWLIFKEKLLISSMTLGYILAIIILFHFGKYTYCCYYGEEIIGSYFEKPAYRTKYYVNVFPDDKNSKNYRLPADIYVFTKREESSTSGSIDEDGIVTPSVKFNKKRILEKVYWPNGGYLDFKDCLIEDREPGIGGKNLCTDNHGRKWYIELTEEKVN